MDTETSSRSSVNITAEGRAIVVRPSGDFDDRAAELIVEVVATARDANAPVVVDLGALAPGHHRGLRVLPLIARVATVRGTAPR